MQEQTDTSVVKPIKRHEALVSYSREHHEGLLLVWKIRSGFRKNIAAERIARYVVHFFEKDLSAHFSDEENNLAPLLPAGDEQMARMMDEHRQIREWVHRLQKQEVLAADVSGFADALERHIRFEERVLFNHLQAQLTPLQLSALVETDRGGHEHPDKGWQDIFWL